MFNNLIRGSRHTPLLGERRRVISDSFTLLQESSEHRNGELEMLVTRGAYGRVKNGSGGWVQVGVGVGDAVWVMDSLGFCALF